MVCRGVSVAGRTVDGGIRDDDCFFESGLRGVMFVRAATYFIQVCLVVETKTALLVLAAWACCVRESTQRFDVPSGAHPPVCGAGERVCETAVLEFESSTFRRRGLTGGLAQGPAFGGFEEHSPFVNAISSEEFGHDDNGRLHVARSLGIVCLFAWRGMHPSPVASRERSFKLSRSLAEILCRSGAFSGEISTVSCRDPSIPDVPFRDKMDSLLTWN